LGSTPVEKDYIQTNILSQLEEITNKSSNLLVHLYTLKILEIILANNWYKLSSKDAWNLIYLANYLFDLYDVLKGTFVAHRSIKHAKAVLMSILERKDPLTVD